MAKLDTFELASPDGFVKTACTLIGSFAVHRAPCKAGWRVSHAATGFGIPSLYPETKQEAVVAAKAMEKAADWSKVVRGADHRSPVMGVPKEELRAAVLAGEEAMIVFAHTPNTASPHSPLQDDADAPVSVIKDSGPPDNAGAPAPRSAFNGDGEVSRG